MKQSILGLVTAVWAYSALVGAQQTYIQPCDDQPDPSTFFYKYPLTFYCEYDPAEPSNQFIFAVYTGLQSCPPDVYPISNTSYIVSPQLQLPVLAGASVPPLPPVVPAIEIYNQTTTTDGPTTRSGVMYLNLQNGDIIDCSSGECYQVPPVNVPGNCTVNAQGTEYWTLLGKIYSLVAAINPPPGQPNCNPPLPEGAGGNEAYLNYAFLNENCDP